MLLRRVDYAAITHNANLVLREGDYAVVKANAYGHDLRETVRALPMATGFAVTGIRDACTIRFMRPRARVLVLNPGCRPSEVRKFEEYDIIGTATTELEASLFNRYAFKIDSGLGRFGARDSEVLRSVDPSLVYSHPYSVFTRRPARVTNWPNSVLRLSELDDDAYMPGRIGAALYGIRDTFTDLPLRRACGLWTEVLAMHPSGRRVGYGQVKPFGPVTAILDAGYADGVPVSLEGCEVSFSDRLAGNVCKGVVSWVGMSHIAVTGDISSDVKYCDLASHGVGGSLARTLLTSTNQE